jgi:hypothetical protein
MTGTVAAMNPDYINMYKNQNVNQQDLGSITQESSILPDEEAYYIQR